MIYLACALYPEAEPWIVRFGLKKQKEFHRMQVFANEQILCVVTGVGELAAAMALTEVFTLRQQNGLLCGEDILVNLGVCGCKDPEIPAKTVYLCHSITDADTGRIYYPDILYRHPFPEGSLFTSTRPLTPEQIQAQPCLLTDMEGAGIYQSGIRFLHPHQMFFLKIVSDHGTQALMTGEDVRQCMEENADLLADWMERWLTQETEPSVFTPEQERKLRHLCRFLKASVTMEQEIRQVLIWCQLTGGSGVERLEAFLREQGVESIASKREGALYFAKFKQQLF